MRDWIRRWLGLEEDRRRAENIAKGMVEPLWQKVAEADKYAVAVDRAATALERIDDSLCVNLNMIGEHLANLRPDIGPEVETPICCPQNPEHTGQLIVTVLEEMDAKTFARRPVGGGMYCPKCQKSYYYWNGRKWAIEGTSVEVEQGVPQDAPKGVHREPETKARPMKFRG